MSGPRRALRWLGVAARVSAGAVAIGRLAGAARAAAPIRRTAPPNPAISVVIPARDESQRLGPLLDAIVGAPGVDEVLVVDDRSTDDTSTLAAAAGATVIAGRELPAGWAGKAWALQQGIDAAAGDWIVTLDADTRPDPALPAAAVARASAERLDLLTVAGRFDCPTPGARWLHPALLTTLVYRFGPPGRDTAPDRAMANGQCMIVRRQPFLEAGGMEPVRARVVEDIALARRLATDGKRVGFLDGSELLTVRMFESFVDTWRGWGRSIALPGVESRPRQLVDLAVVALAQAAPLVRLATGRPDPVDAILLLARLGTLLGTRTAYVQRGVGYWLSPLADPLAVIVLAVATVRRGPHVWRGRTYG